jgi:EF-P beta-lysylation protein EpmB
MEKTFTNIAELLDFLEFDGTNREKVLVNPKFITLVPMRLAQKMAKNNPECPIFLQFVPLKKELEKDPSFNDEPVKDTLFKVGKKILQKYEGRSLILTTKACAMHCRYCFRQNFPYYTEQKGFREEIDLIKTRSDLHEVILSGGDPLSLDHKSLLELLHELNRIDHLQFVRFHTRTLISHPEKITEELIDFFKTTSKKIVFVLHINHPLEIDDQIVAVCTALKKVGVTLLSQSVLLKGVNDNYETLKKLCLHLFKAGILPYYLHQLDRVQGGKHFEVDKEVGLNLVQKLRESLPGYLVPKYVEEIPNQKSKTPVENATSALTFSSQES